MFFFKISISIYFFFTGPSKTKEIREHAKDMKEKLKLILVSVITSDDELHDDSSDEYSVYDYENQPSDESMSGRAITGAG